MLDWSGNFSMVLSGDIIANTKLFFSILDLKAPEHRSGRFIYFEVLYFI